jgi:hypothetical protein
MNFKDQIFHALFLKMNLFPLTSVKTAALAAKVTIRVFIKTLTRASIKKLKIKINNKSKIKDKSKTQIKAKVSKPETEEKPESKSEIKLNAKMKDRMTQKIKKLKKLRLIHNIMKVWYLRLKHLNTTDIIRLAKNSKSGVKIKDSKILLFCKTCKLANFKKKLSKTPM